MSGRGKGGLLLRVQQAAVLLVVFVLLWGATHLVPEVKDSLGAIAATGFLVLAGTIASELLEPLKIPHLTAYIITGIVAGPYVLDLIDEKTVAQVGKTDALALALIALAGGAELRLADLRKNARTLGWITLLQTCFVPLVVVPVFYLAAPFMPFLRGAPHNLVLAVSILWGVISITRSPSALLAVLSQTRAQGPIAQVSLATIMISDVVVLVVMATAFTLTKPLIEPGAVLSAVAFRELGREVLGSVSLGTTLGLLLVAYLKFVSGSTSLVLLALGIGFTEVLKYLHFEPLLTFLVAGFVVQNLSGQGKKFLHGIEGLGSIVYVVFFAAAGAHLDVPILRQLWPMALLLCGVRAVVTIIANTLATRVAGESPVVRRWGWSALVSQAGMALGVGALIARQIPSVAGIRALVLATIAVNELIGPILFKTALDRTGESRGHDAPDADEPATIEDPAAVSRGGVDALTSSSHE